jgi:hypothetical protein
MPSIQPTRILPDLQASLLCEDVRQEASGSFIIIGVIGVIRVPQVPITALKLCVFNRWTAGIGTFGQTVRFIGPDGTTVLRQHGLRFALQDAAQHAINVTVFGQLEFPAAGVYHIEVTVDEVMKLRYPVPVVVQAPPGGAQTPSTPPTETQ